MLSTNSVLSTNRKFAVAWFRLYNVVSVAALIHILVLLCLSPLITEASKPKSTTVSTDNVMQLGPVHIFSSLQNRASYSWSSAVNLSLGMADSRELTVIAPSVVRQKNQDAAIVDPQDRDCDWDKMVLQLFETYPIWLCRGMTSFGLLKAVPSEDQPKCFDIRTRWWGVNLLSFDRPKRNRREQFIRSYIIPTAFSNLGREKVCTVSTVTIPISGGFFGAGKDTKVKGVLVFKLQTTKVAQNGDRFVAGGKRTLITEIHNYRPMLCGTTIPFKTHRVRLYLGTQSLAHAFVMWRFHKHIVRNMFGNFRQKTTT
jgi:hypothetical protein